MKKIRVILVDDHAVLIAGLRVLINAQPDLEVVGEANDGDSASALAAQAHPDVVVLDLSMQGSPSLPLITKLKQLAGSARVLILTMHDDPAYVRAALSAGASGYLTKTVHEKVVLQAIRDVHQGRMVIDLDDERATAAVFQSVSPSSQASARVSSLSKREEQVLRLLGQGFSNQAIAQQLDVSPKTIATYRSRIAEKLGLRSTADFVKFAVDVGLVSPTGKHQ